MNRRYLHHGVIITGILSFGFLFWYVLFPAGEQQMTVAQLRELLINGTTPEERALGAAGLGQRSDTPSVGLLLQAMKDDSELVRARAGVAVKKILGTDFYFKANAPPEQRQAALDRYHELWRVWKEKTGYKEELPTKLE